MDKLEVQIGLKFDTELTKKFKDINSSLKENNNGMCNILYCEFEKDDEEMKAD